METAKLKKFAQFARRSLMEQVSAKLKLVFADDSAARRESAKAVKELDEAIQKIGKAQVIERVAYIWFNRFCALRFMDVNRYTRIGVVSPVEGQSQPEILAEAKMGHIDEEMVPEKIRQQIFALLDGKAPSRDPQGEAYRLLVVAACNFWNKAMPFLFQRIDDYTELLMPDDLLSGNSILAYTREAMTPDACEDVEVIGWLYQFYISEKKDEVFDGLKKNKKITPENIPAATQLFTPHWIVRYLVENSLGRLWLLNRPGSKLIEQMDYYIKPEQAETDFLRIGKPEEIKICDPACGSGHMLTYAFDLLYAIYEEEGVDPAEIPEKILTNNLYGIEIDERAGELAAFALTMKARAKQRRFFNKGVKPNICVLENVHFDGNELKDYMDFVGRDLFTAPLQTTLRQFEEADNFGSLIRPDVTDVNGMLTILKSKNVSGQLFISMTHQKVLQALRQADYLSPKYHVVIANPPYMGGKGMNGRLAAWVKDNYPNSKSDLFAMFIERNLDLVQQHGVVAMITMQSWMFLGSYAPLRKKIFETKNLVQLFHTGPGLFPELGAFNVLTSCFIIANSKSNHPSCFIKANESPSINNKIGALNNISNHIHTSTDVFKSIPDSPILYWLSNSALTNFTKFNLLGDVCPPRQGLATADNSRFVRLWYEVELNKIGFEFANSIDAQKSRKKWFPYNKGGNYRKWFGNNECVVNWENDGEEIRGFVDDKGSVRSAVRNADFYFREGIVYSLFGFENFGVRYKSSGFIFDVSGSSIFPDQDVEIVLAFLSSNIAFFYLRALAPTVNFQVGDLARLPLSNLTGEDKTLVSNLAKQNIALCKSDWDSEETSWDFSINPLLLFRGHPFQVACKRYMTACENSRNLLRDNEQSINQIFARQYNLIGEVDTDVNDRDLSISTKELNELVIDFISYAVGCMFGRYALDKPGLILANQGETLADFVRKLASDQWPVASKKGESYAGEKLQGSDRLAEGHGFGGVGVSSDKAISERGALRSYQSGAAGGGLDSIQHSGRASASILSGVQKLSVDSEGIVGGSGNTTADCNTAQLPNSGTTSTNHGSASRNQQNASSTDGQTSHWPLDTSHLSFVPDEDNVIPMLDGDWFTDDIAERFRKFLRVAFGEEHYEANLRFVEQALNIKGKRNYGIRDYFLGEFYTDHVKRYKKRPIYWLFSSPKGSFNALIYMHRYRPDTVSVVLNDYLREFRTKLTSHKNHLEAVSISASARPAEKTAAIKEIEKLNKTLAELDEWEREVLYPLAARRIEIDLDDGVKVNYNKFGAALKKVPGLSE